MNDLVPAAESYRVVGVAQNTAGQTVVQVMFPNGYGASVIGGPVTRPGIPSAYADYEVGILNGVGDLIYHTPFSPYDAIRRYGEVSEIPGLLAEIASLPAGTSGEYPDYFVSDDRWDEEESGDEDGIDAAILDRYLTH